MTHTRPVRISLRSAVAVAALMLLAACGGGDLTVRDGPQRVHPSTSAAARGTVAYANVPATAARPAAAAVQPSGSPYNAFMAACLGLGASPSGTVATLQSLGFRSSGQKNGAATFAAPFATAALARGGQCTVTPAGGNFSQSVRFLNRSMPASVPSAVKIGGEEAWLLPDRSVVLVSRAGGALTRTMPGVFK